VRDGCIVRLGDVGGRKGRTGIARRLAHSVAGRPFDRDFEPGEPGPRWSRGRGSKRAEPGPGELDSPDPPPSDDSRREDPRQQDSRRDACGNPASRGA
jgi:hypothetical protein